MSEETRKILGELAALLKESSAPIETFEILNTPFGSVTKKIETAYCTMSHVAHVLERYAEEG